MKYQVLLPGLLTALCLMTGCNPDKKAEPQQDNPPQINAESQPVLTNTEELQPSTDSGLFIENSEQSTQNSEQIHDDSEQSGEIQETPPDNTTDDSQETEQTVDIHSFEPLSESQRQILENITWDVAPEVLNAVKTENEGQHFLRSDERHPELFRESIENIGHTYIGIGTDQGYVFIGWQRPSLAFLVDYDPWVIVLHRIYMAIFKVCEDSSCMMKYFDDRDFGLEFLKTIPELSDKTTQTVFKEAHRGVTYSLSAIRRMKVKTFMNDPETYQYIRNLILNGRLKTFQANLLGDKAFASIQSTLNQLNASVGVLYLSNAEQYWAYTEQFKTNMLGLPYSDNALVIRTIATKPFNQDYRYSVQKAEVFKTWLEHPDTKSVKTIIGRTRIKEEDEIPLTFDNQLPKN